MASPRPTPYVPQTRFPWPSFGSDRGSPGKWRRHRWIERAARASVTARYRAAQARFGGEGCQALDSCLRLMEVGVGAAPQQRLDEHGGCPCFPLRRVRGEQTIERWTDQFDRTVDVAGPRLLPSDMDLDDEQVVAEVADLDVCLTEFREHLSASDALGAFSMDHGDGSRSSCHRQHEVVTELLCRIEYLGCLMKSCVVRKQYAVAMGTRRTIQSTPERMAGSIASPAAMARAKSSFQPGSPIRQRVRPPCAMAG